MLVLDTFSSGNTRDSLKALSTSISTATGALFTLLSISEGPRVMIDTIGIRGQIGQRSSTRLTVVPTSSRPVSMVSSQSITSRRSDMDARRMRVRGLDEEFQDQEEERDRISASRNALSASDSQTSLPRHTLETKGRGDMSATSSTTSLGYQQTESDSGSHKGNRSSFMRFMRGRSSSDTAESTVQNRILFIFTLADGVSR